MFCVLKFLAAQQEWKMEHLYQARAERAMSRSTNAIYICSTSNFLLHNDLYEVSFSCIVGENIFSDSRSTEFIQLYFFFALRELEAPGTFTLSKNLWTKSPSECVIGGRTEKTARQNFCRIYAVCGLENRQDVHPQQHLL